MKSYADGLRLDPANKSIMEGLLLAQKGVTGQLEATIAAQMAPQGRGTVAAAAQSIKVGQTVEIFGLKGAPQHNGTQGAVLSYDQPKGRFVVQVTAQPSLQPSLLPWP